ncbi:MAG TPA: hypothetical protein ENJ97_00175, partial [Planctomycetes bacterium]|nr:hypothetical protein [Planctomycetota bacterium]
MSRTDILVSLAWAALFFLPGGGAISQETGKAAEPPSLSPPMASLLSALEENGFAYGPPVEKAFLAAARMEFENLLKKEGIHPSKALRAWLEKHQDLARSLYICLDPQDPRIAANLDRLISDLGPEVCDEYAQLVFAVSVARREIGVGPVDLGPTARISNLFRKKRRRPSRRKQTLSPEENARAIQALKAFLKDKGWSPLEAYRNKDAAFAFLASKGILPGRNPVADLKRLQAWLQEIFLEEGKVPRRRDPFPSMAEYIRHLLEIQKVKVAPFAARRGRKVTWPMFPLKSPWPLLMPLAQPIPLREQNYVWEKFLGGFGPKDRLHLYGPYVHGGKFEERLVPSPWHYQSYPALIRIGGVCGTMSSIAKFAYVSLGVPALKCAQPGHSCLFRFARDGEGNYFARILQGVSTPYRTTTIWLMGDARTYRAKNPGKIQSVGFEYYAGQALAVNQGGLKNYVTSKALVNLFLDLPGPERKTLGPRILGEARRLCPFNVEPWYLLNTLGGYDLEKALGLVRRLRALVPLAPPAPRRSRRSRKALEAARRTYLDAVCLALLEKAAAGRNSFEPARWKEILAGIRKEEALNRYRAELSKEEFLCRLHVDGTEKTLEAVKQTFASLTGRPPQRKRSRKRAVARFLAQVGALCLARPKGGTLSFLQTLLSSLPPGLAFKVPGEKDLPRAAKDLQEGRFRPKKTPLYVGL